MNIKNEIAPKVITALIERVIKSLDKEKQTEIGNDIEVVDWDLRRVYMTCSGKQTPESGCSIFIRTWNIYERGNWLHIEYTLYDETNIVTEGLCTGPERLIGGQTKFDKRKFKE